MSLVSSIQSLFSGEKPEMAALAYYDPINGEEVIGGSFQAFQYFPEKIQDTKGVDYSSKTIPGGSHPIYTFISGGERTISFEAIFINDDVPKSATNLLNGKTYSIKDADKRDIVNIANAISWLRYCMYPTYNNGVAKAPPLVVVYLPNSGIIGTGNYAHSVVGILRRADVSYEAFHRDGTPRIAVVSIEIAEVVQTKKSWKWHDGDSLDYKGYQREPLSKPTKKDIIGLAR